MLLSEYWAHLKNYVNRGTPPPEGIATDIIISHGDAIIEVLNQFHIHGNYYGRANTPNEHWVIFKSRGKISFEAFIRPSGKGVKWEDNSWGINLVVPGTPADATEIASKFNVVPLERKGQGAKSCDITVKYEMNENIDILFSTLKESQFEQQPPVKQESSVKQELSVKQQPPVKLHPLDDMTFDFINKFNQSLSIELKERTRELIGVHRNGNYNFYVILLAHAIIDALLRFYYKDFKGLDYAKQKFDECRFTSNKDSFSDWKFAQLLQIGEVDKLITRDRREILVNLNKKRNLIHLYRENYPSYDTNVVIDEAIESLREIYDKMDG